jgi:hypothetical protein
MHTEISVKVNAYVDAGVAPLVEALNQFPEVVTLDSCEGSADSATYVCFAVRGDAATGFTFVQCLSASLGNRLHSCCDYSLQLEWGAGAEQPLARIVTQPHYVATLAAALAEIAPLSAAV